MVLQNLRIRIITNQQTIKLKKNYKMQEFARLIKCIMVGGSQTGKSALSYKYVENKFLINHIPTIGVDFKVKCINIDGTKVKLQIWDTAGQERFKTITKVYYKSASVVFFVFDLTNYQSFNETKKKIVQLYKDFICEKDAVAILVGNKCDLEEQRKVSYQEANKLGQCIGKYIEVSAKDGINVQELFSQALSYKLSLDNFGSAPGRKSFMEMVQSNYLYFNQLENSKKQDIYKQKKTQIKQQIEVAAPGGANSYTAEKINYVKSQVPQQTQYIIIKSILVGNDKVGKSTILENYVHDIVVHDYKPTIGVDFGTKKLDYQINGKFFKHQCWDTAGQQRFKTITHAYYKGSKVVFLVYDITDVKSYQNAIFQFNTIFEQVQRQKIYLCLVANKKDLVSVRAVSTQQGMKTAQQYKVDYIELNARNHEDVENMFARAVKYLSEHNLV